MALRGSAYGRPRAAPTWRRQRRTRLAVDVGFQLGDVVALFLYIVTGAAAFYWIITL